MMTKLSDFLRDRAESFTHDGFNAALCAARILDIRKSTLGQIGCRPLDDPIFAYYDEKEAEAQAEMELHASKVEVTDFPYVIFYLSGYTSEGLRCRPETTPQRLMAGRTVNFVGVDSAYMRNACAKTSKGEVIHVPEVWRFYVATRAEYAELLQTVRREHAAMRAERRSFVDRERAFFAGKTRAPRTRVKPSVRRVTTSEVLSKYGKYVKKVR